MKIIYFGDYAGDLIEEAEYIKRDLESEEIRYDIFEIRETPEFFDNEAFDVLFFDWGGASIGNSLMDDFCRLIIKDAEDHPSRIYILNSIFTRYAMNDALKELGTDIPNIFFDLYCAVPYLRSEKCL